LPRYLYILHKFVIIMLKNKWYLTKINSDSFNLSMIVLDSAYAIEQLIKNKNQPKYKEDLKKCIVLLNLLKKIASNQINNSNIDDKLLDTTVHELAISLSGIQISELDHHLSNVINALESQNYNHTDIDFFMKIYDAMNKGSREIVLSKIY